MIPHDRSAEHYARVERERIEGEPWLDALRRIAVEDAVAACGGSQKRAAALLRETEATVGRAVRRAREVRGNAAAGRPDLSEHASVGKPAAWKLRLVAAKHGVAS